MNLFNFKARYIFVHAFVHAALNEIKELLFPKAILQNALKPFAYVNKTKPIVLETLVVGYHQPSYGQRFPVKKVSVFIF